MPLSGNIDFVRVLQDRMEVIDYKTGNPANASKKLRSPFAKRFADPLGGDYWRQIIFYRILLDADPRMQKPMHLGSMLFVQPQDNGSFKVEDFDVSKQDIAFVSDQIVETYDNILTHKFDNGCNEPDCTWCNLIKDQFKIEGVLPEIEDDL